MAVNELPIERKTFKADATLLPYSKVANGSPLAGTDRSMTLQTDGELRPAGNGAFVVGKLEILMQSLQASVTTIGQDLGFKQGAVGACVVGMGIVGDTGPDVNGTTGYVRAPAQNRRCYR